MPAAPRRSGATPGRGGAAARPDDDGDSRLSGHLPDATAFEAEFPGADLVSSRLARSLERLGQSVETRVALVFRQHGLSHAAGNALAVIEGADGPVTPGEISEAMHITSGSITSLLDTLERRELVERSAHEDDRRKILVRVTAAGRDLLDEALPAIQLLTRELFAALSASERTRLLALVERAYDSVTGVDLTTLPTGPRIRPDRS